MSNKTRLDILLTERGLAESRQKAQAVIMAGHVFVAGQRVDKPGSAVLSDAPIEVRGHALPYVSRGGLKLEKALKTFPITQTDKICADIGASTGGFTDCMLQNGARKVYSVDVGYGQLDWKLRSDPRVVCMERTNARYLTPEQIPDPLDFASIDVSFISLKLIFPALYGLLRQGVGIRQLVRPGQLESSRRVIDWVARTFRPGEVLFSLKSQYTPQPGAEGPLRRQVTAAEFRAAAEYMENCGIVDDFVQERTSAREEYTPAFDLTGV